MLLGKLENNKEKGYSDMTENFFSKAFFVLNGWVIKSGGDLTCLSSFWDYLSDGQPAILVSDEEVGH